MEGRGSGEVYLTSHTASPRAGGTEDSTPSGNHLWSRPGTPRNKQRIDRRHRAYRVHRQAMPVLNTVPVHYRRGAVFRGGLAAAAFATAIVIDLVLQRSPIADAPPRWSWWDLLRSGAIAACALLSISTLLRLRPVRAGSCASAPISAATPAAVCLGLAATCVALLAFAPTVYEWLCQEDSWVENSSAAAMALAAAVGAHLCVRGANHHALRVAAAAVAAFFALCALEEVSWFQRVLDIETSAWFEGNLQNETNLHNFATDKLETLYYSGAFAMLVALPWAAEQLPLRSLLGPLGPLVPGRRAVACAAPCSAFNYDMWNNAAMQLALAGTLAILGHFALASHRAGARREARIWMGLTVATVGIQASFLCNGAAQERIWSVTEYRELLIAIACAAYAIDVRRQVAAPR